MSKRLLVVCTLVVVLLAGGASGAASAQGQPAMPPMGAHKMEAMPMGDLVRALRQISRALPTAVSASRSLQFVLWRNGNHSIAASQPLFHGTATL